MKPYEMSNFSNRTVHDAKMLIIHEKVDAEGCMCHE